MKALQFSQRVSLRVPPRDLWKFLYDTDRLNRLMRLPSISFKPDPDRRRKGHFQAEIAVGPIRLRYEEYPFEWIEERFFSVFRRFGSGPFLHFEGGVRLHPTETGTDLEVFSVVQPRNPLGIALARALIGKKATAAFIAQGRAFETGFLTSEKRPPVMEKTTVLMSQLDLRCKALASAVTDPRLLEKLRELIIESSVNDVTRMRPFELAHRWGRDRYDVLRLMLFATKGGLVDLHWEILCPHCRAPAESGQTLGAVKASAACETCDIRFAVDLANSVEAVFSVNPGVRVAQREIYCIGSPANSPRVMAQFRLNPGETRQQRLSTPPGLLMVRSYQSSGLVPLESAASGPATLNVRCDEKLSVSSGRFASTGTEVTLQNNLKEECLLVFEHQTWRASAATAAIVTTIQEFRDLFPQEAVAPGQEIGVGRLAVLFTDLSGSTELYESLGDVKAFDFVQSHFQFLIRLVAQHRGGVVKTMGDAIMATFNSGLDAISAAVSMQEDWDAFLSKYHLPNAIRLKVGLHQGPAVVFNNKGMQDYFGGTVNMAARIQAQAAGGEVVISQALRDDPDVQNVIESRFSDTEAFAARLKGIAETQTLHRFHPTVKHN